MLVTTPSRTARPLDRVRRAAAAWPRSDWTPSTTSTTAPASFTAVNTAADAATTAARPAAASAPHARTPSELPAVHANASRRPPRAALRTTSAVAGPGASDSTSATGRNATSVPSTALRRGRRDDAHLGPADPSRRVVELGHRRQALGRRPRAVERFDPAARDDGVAEALAVLV